MSIQVHEVVRQAETELHLRGDDYRSFSGPEQEQLEGLLTAGHSQLQDLHEQVYTAAADAGDVVKDRQARVDELHAQPLGTFGALKLAIAESRLKRAQNTLAYRQADVDSVEARYQVSVA